MELDKEYPNAQDIAVETDTEPEGEPVETFKQVKCSCGSARMQFLGIDEIPNPILHIICMNCGNYLKLTFNPNTQEIIKSTPSYAG